MLAGCGGDGGREQARSEVSGPRVERALANGLAGRSEEVARRLESGDPCGARAEADALRNDLIAAINARRVPQEYLEDLTAAANEIAEQIPECAPPPPEPPPPDGEADEDEGNGEDDEKGKGEKKGKGAEKRKDKENGNGRGNRADGDA